MKNQTAVEWLIDKINHDNYVKALDAHEWIKIFEYAKRMEKQQIIDAAFHGVDHENSPYENPEDYYNNIYGKIN